MEIVKTSMFLSFFNCDRKMNCDTAIILMKNNIRVTRVLPASMGAKKSGLELSTFAVPGLYFLFVEVIH